MGEFVGCSSSHELPHFFIVFSLPLRGNATVEGCVYMSQPRPLKNAGSKSSLWKTKLISSCTLSSQQPVWRGGWGTLAQRAPTTRASYCTRCCDHIVGSEERAKFRSRPTWHRKSQVGQHNSGILADWYKMCGLPQSFQYTVLLILGYNPTTFHHTGFQG